MKLNKWKEKYKKIEEQTQDIFFFLIEKKTF